MQEDQYDPSSTEEDDGLTTWKNPPTVADLKNDYTEAQSAHQAHTAKVDTWLDNLNITNGAKRAKVEGKSSIQPKLIRKQAEWRYSALSEPFLSTYDLFDVSPVTYEDKKGAEQNQLLLNYQINCKINKTKFIDEFVRTAVDEGTVITRTGWVFEEEEVDEDVYQVKLSPTQDPNDIQMLQRLAQLAQQDPEGFQANVPEASQLALQKSSETGVPHRGEEVKTGTRKVKKTTKNQPVVEICNYNNVIIDPTAKGDITAAAFVIYSFETSKSELEKSGDYVNLDKINLNTASVLAAPDHIATEEQDSFKFSDDARKRIVAFEYWGYWDIDDTGKTKPIVATWVGNTMIRLEENPFPTQFMPFDAVQYLPVREENFGEPDGELLQDNQDIIGAVSRGMIDSMGRSAVAQTGIRKDALDIVNRRKFDAGKDYEFNANVDPRAVIYMHEYPEIPQSAPLMLQMQNQEAESLTGVKAFAGGLSGAGLEGGSTATATRGVLDASSKRELGILRRLSDGVTSIGRKFIAMNSEFLSDEEVVRVTNEEFVPIRRDDLSGQYDIKLTISTAEADNQKAEELAFMLQTMGNTMPREFSQMVLAEIAMLRNMPDLAKRIEEFEPKPDPAQEQLQQLEMQKLQAEISKLQSEAMENQSDAMLNQAKSGTEQAKASTEFAKTASEQAKAGNLQANTDKTNLDYLEQESGVTQERELQIQSEQAKANMNLKAFEHQLDLQKPQPNS